MAQEGTARAQSAESACEGVKITIPPEIKVVSKHMTTKGESFITFMDESGATGFVCFSPNIRAEIVISGESSTPSYWQRVLAGELP